MLSLRSVECHSNQVNAHASDATIIVRFASTRNSGILILYQMRLASRRSIYSGK